MLIALATIVGEVDDRGLYNSSYCRKCVNWKPESEYGGSHCKKYSLRNKYLPECCGRDNGRELIMAEIY